MNPLKFGYPPPENVRSAWGARLIVDQRGHTDLVPNRQDAFPEDWKELQTWLNGGALRSALDKLSELLANYQLGTRETREVVLHEDEQGRIIGNPNSSAGYCYIVGWLFKDEAVTA